MTQTNRRKPPNTAKTPAVPAPSVPMDRRIIIATTHLMIHRGLRRLRSAHIAAEAETTESTVFRHFGDMNGLLAATYHRTWQVINEAVGAAAYENPVRQDPVDILLDDVRAIFELQSDPELREAACVAFLFMRRRHEMFDDESTHGEPDEAQVRFETRLGHLTRSIVALGEELQDADATASLLQTRILNQLATVWLTWFCMPAGSNDLGAPAHDLAVDEAVMGVTLLIDLALHPDTDEMSRLFHGVRTAPNASNLDRARGLRPKLGRNRE